MKKTSFLIKTLTIVSIMFALSLAFNLNEAKATTGEDIFDYKLYADTNEDVKAAFGYDEDALYNHYISYGLNEGRVGSLVFDQTYYVNRYSDLASAFGTDYVAAFNHYLSYGVAEGRQGSIEFDSVYYVSIYEDLQNAFGNDYEKITEHYIDYGANEGRRGSLEFDVKYYLSENSDLATAFGEDGYRNGLVHFIQYGINEGRATSEDFIVEYYKANYSDLQNAFGDGVMSYFIHYSNYGEDEGRIADYLITDDSIENDNDTTEDDNSSDTDTDSNSDTNTDTDSDTNTDTDDNTDTDTDTDTDDDDEEDTETIVVRSDLATEMYNTIAEYYDYIVLDDYLTECAMIRAEELTEKYATRRPSGQLISSFSTDEITVSLQEIQKTTSDDIDELFNEWIGTDGGSSLLATGYLGIGCVYNSEDGYYYWDFLSGYYK